LCPRHCHNRNRRTIFQHQWRRCEISRGGCRGKHFIVFFQYFLFSFPRHDFKPTNTITFKREKKLTCYSTEGSIWQTDCYIPRHQEHSHTNSNSKFSFLLIFFLFFFCYFFFSSLFLSFFSFPGVWLFFFFFLKN